MPFEQYASRRHHIPKARRRAMNWPAYEAGLRRRGDLTLWLDEGALSGWHAPRRTTRGGQPVYAEVAIELVLTLRLVFHLALRQAGGFARSVLRLLGLDVRIPDHSTLSRRGRTFAGRQPRATRHDEPVHVVLDNTGLQVFGQGEWDAEKHGRTPRQWRKLHLAVNVETGEIVAHSLTDKVTGDIPEVAGLLATVEGQIASVIADGAYDGASVYDAAAACALNQMSGSPCRSLSPRADMIIGLERTLTSSPVRAPTPGAGATAPTSQVHATASRTRPRGCRESEQPRRLASMALQDMHLT